MCVCVCSGGYVYTHLLYIVMELIEIPQGQFIKWVSPYGPADLAGMLPGDHVLYVDSENVMECSHHQASLSWDMMS